MFLFFDNFLEGFKGWIQCSLEILGKIFFAQ